MNHDHQVYLDDLDGEAELSVHDNGDEFVTVIIAGPDGEDPVDILLAPETARRVARAITLASFEAEGTDTSALAALTADLAEEDDADGYDEDEPIPYATVEDRAAWYTQAKDIAHGRATASDVLELARYLAGE